jgi:group I intron endonuclease
MGFIYQILNLQSNKCYIGQSRQKTHSARWCQHKHQAFVKNAKSSALYDAMRSYGLNAFQFIVILENVPDDDLNRIEEETIAAHNSLVPNGYNIKRGGNHTPHSEETRRKIGEKSKGRQTNTGKVFSAEWRQNIGNASRGRKFSQPVKEHLSKAHTDWHDKHPIAHKNCKYTEEDIRFMRHNPENLTIEEMRVRFKIERYRLMMILNKQMYGRVSD